MDNIQFYYLETEHRGNELLYIEGEDQPPISTSISALFSFYWYGFHWRHFAFFQFCFWY